MQGEMVVRKLGEMAILDDTGDTKIIWDNKNDEEVENARDQFKRLRKKGFLAYRVKKNGEKAEMITEFDEDAEKIILSPPLAGG